MTFEMENTRPLKAWCTLVPKTNEEGILVKKRMIAVEEWSGGREGGPYRVEEKRTNKRSFSHGCDANVTNHRSFSLECPPCPLVVLYVCWGCPFKNGGEGKLRGKLIFASFSEMR